MSLLDEINSSSFISYSPRLFDTTESSAGLDHDGQKTNHHHNDLENIGPQYCLHASLRMRW